MANKQEMEEKRHKDKKALYAIILMFPSLLLGIVARIDHYMIWLTLTVLIISFQFILIKNFLDDYYGY